MKIAICFRGITRALEKTIGSIIDNVFNPCKKLGYVRVYSHLYDQKKIISNVRSNEVNCELSTDYGLLQNDWLMLENPEMALKKYKISEIESYGDAWNDDYKSLRNHVIALHSMKLSYLEARKWRPDLYIFLRPDLMYHDSFFLEVKKCAQNSNKDIFIPYWQGWKGLNDRFALTANDLSAWEYATRIDKILEYCKNTNKDLHSEKFLLYALRNHSIPIRLINLKASRVRANSVIHEEDFSFLTKKNFPGYLYAIKSLLMRSAQ
jgi:hypothetical protein